MKANFSFEENDMDFQIIKTAVAGQFAVMQKQDLFRVDPDFWSWKKEAGFR